MDLRESAIRLLQKTERYTKTDMTYLVTSGFWSNAGTVFVSLASFLLYIIFNRYVSKNDYGTYQYLLSVGAIVGAFTLTGMNSAVVRSVALGEEGSLRYAVRTQLKWAIVPLIGSWLVGAYYLYLHNYTLGWGFVLIGIFVPINNAFNTFSAFPQGKKDFKRGFLLGLWWNIPYYLAVGIAAIFFKAALILLAANLISQAIGLFISYKQTLKTYKPNNITNKETLTYGGHLSAMGLLGSIAGQLDSVLAFHFLGATELAIYSFATAVPDRIGGLLKFVPAAALPKFAGKSPEEIRQSLGYRLMLGTLVSVVIAFIYVLIAYPFFYIFFPAYLVAVPFSMFYALSLAASMSSVLANALIANHDVRMLYAYNIVNPVVQVMLMVVGILMYGLFGLIAARIASSFFALFFGIVLYWRAK